MALPPGQSNRPAAPVRRRLRGSRFLALCDRVRRPFDLAARRYPFLVFVLLLLLSNVAGSVFSFYYNTHVILHRQMRDNPAQQAAFWNVAAPLYNAIAYPVCVTAMWLLVRPAYRCLARLRRGEAVEPECLEFCRRRVVNLPWLQVLLNLGGWAPGALFFPAVIFLVAGADNWPAITGHFVLSFVVTALFATAQTFFALQYYLVAYLYADFFRDARPEQVRGARLVPFWFRLLLLWLAVAWMPLVALYCALAGDAPIEGTSVGEDVGVVLFVASSISSLVIFLCVGVDLLRWITIHAAATERVGRGDFDVRIGEQRPDEWGLLSNRFNDMAEALGRARQVRETFGEFVSPEVSAVILDRMHGLEVSVQEVTVLFADIRGFTRRCAGEPPEQVGALLNRFLTLALRAVDEEQGGYVNKFLGDGVMVLFNATRPRDDHADLALACAHDLLANLAGLNRELEAQGQPPLALGVGIHTGPALVGCFGAVLHDAAGKVRRRREFTAIGDTVNTCQRLEQLTKRCGGPILVSEQTRQRLTRPVPLACLGAHLLPGCHAPVVVHRVEYG